jgi:hypothetical protein
MAVTAYDVVIPVRSSDNSTFIEIIIPNNQNGILGFDGSNNFGIRTISTNDISDNAVTLSKIQQAPSTNRFLGRITSGAGNYEGISAGDAITILNTATTEKLNFVRLQTLADNTVLGNVSGSTASPVSLTADNIVEILNTATIPLDTSVAPGSGGSLPIITNNTLLGNTSGSSATATEQSANNVVTIINSATSTINLGRIQTIGNNTVLGNTSGGTASPTAQNGDNLITIINTGTSGLINFARLTNVLQYRILGSITSGTNPVTALTMDNLIASLNAAGTTTLNTTIVPNDRLSGIPNNRFFGNVGGVVAPPQAITSDDAIGLINATATTTLATNVIPTITYSKIQNISATNRFLGRITGGAGTVEELNPENAITILNSASTNTLNFARITNVAQYRILGSITSGTNPVTPLEPDDITLLLTQATITTLRRRTQYYEFYTDFENGVAGTIFTSTQAGSGAAVSATTPNNVSNQIGIISFTTGTTNSGRASIITNTGMFQSGIGELTFEAIGFRLGATNSGGQRFTTQIGFIDTATVDQVDGIYFEYNNTNVNNWTMVTASNSTRTRTITTGAFAPNTSYNLKIVVDSAATLATFYVDDVSVGTISTNIPTGLTRLFGAGAFILKSSGNTAITQTIDAIYIRHDLTTNR